MEKLSKGLIQKEFPCIFFKTPILKKSGKDIYKKMCVEKPIFSMLKVEKILKIIDRLFR